MPPTHSEIRFLTVAILSSILSNHFYAFKFRSPYNKMNLFANNFHRAFRRLYRTICFLNFGAINFFFQNFFFINVTYCLNNVELWKHGFSSPLCQILKSLLIEILEIMITIRKKKEKPKVRLESKFHKKPSKSLHRSITPTFFLFLRRLHLCGLDLCRWSLRRLNIWRSWNVLNVKVAS